jgi:site-specific recombinase XerD
MSRKGEAFRSVRTAFTTACRHANLHDVTPHTLRHTFASRLAMAGVGLRTIQELGGWKEIKMVERYSHLSDQHKAEAVELISQNSTTLFTQAKAGA